MSGSDVATGVGHSGDVTPVILEANGAPVTADNPLPTTAAVTATVDFPTGADALALDSSVQAVKTAVDAVTTAIQGLNTDGGGTAGGATETTLEAVQGLLAAQPTEAQLTAALTSLQTALTTARTGDTVLLNAAQETAWLNALAAISTAIGALPTYALTRAQLDSAPVIVHDPGAETNTAATVTAVNAVATAVGTLLTDAQLVAALTTVQTALTAARNGDTTSISAASLTTLTTAMQSIVTAVQAIPAPPSVAGLATETSLAALLAKTDDGTGTGSVLALLKEILTACQTTAVDVATLDLSNSTIQVNTATMEASLASVVGLLTNTTMTQAQGAAIIAALASVPVTIAALPLPAGAAKDATLTAIEALLAGTINTAIVGTVPVSAAALPLPAGASTEATLAAVKTAVQGTLNVSDATTHTTLTAIQGLLAGTLAVSAVALPLPAGAATSANQATEITALGLLHTDLGVVETDIVAVTTAVTAAHTDATTAATTAHTDAGQLHTDIGTTIHGDLATGGPIGTLLAAIKAFFTSGAKGALPIEGVAGGTPVPISGTVSTSSTEPLVDLGVLTVPAGAGGTVTLTISPDGETFEEILLEPKTYAASIAVGTSISPTFTDADGDAIDPSAVDMSFETSTGLKAFTGWTATTGAGVFPTGGTVPVPVSFKHPSLGTVTLARSGAANSTTTTFQVFGRRVATEDRVLATLSAAGLGGSTSTPMQVVLPSASTSRLGGVGAAVRRMRTQPVLLTSTALGMMATFTGSAISIDTTNQADQLDTYSQFYATQIRLWAMSDQAGMAYLELSADGGTTWPFNAAVGMIPANTAAGSNAWLTAAVPVPGGITNLKARVVITNGTTAQTLLRVYYQLEGEIG